MDLGALMLVLMLLALAGGYVALPFFSERMVAGQILRSEREQRRSRLLAERERILVALQEIEMDEKLGKLPSDEYQQQRMEWLLKGEVVLKDLQALEAVEVSRVAAQFTPVVRHSGDLDELEQLIAARRQTRNEKSGGFCPQCGKPVQKSDRFCAGCGTSLKNVS